MAQHTPVGAEKLVEAPAIYVNDMYLVGLEAGVRLTFAEHIPDHGDPQLRVNLLLPYKNARELRDALVKYLED
jgi:hypothetical protein